MHFFTSTREKHLWLWAFAVFTAIFSTLFIGQPLARLFSSQDFRAVIFLIVMILVGATIIVHSFRTKPSKIEITVLLGIVAVYIMFILRLGMPERSHLMEYSVLAIFIHKAITERIRNGKQITMPALFSFIIAFLIGVLDEGVQIILPNRVFDPLDILFNGFVIMMAIGSGVILSWVRKLAKSKLKRK